MTELWIGSCHAEKTDHLPVEIVETKSFRSDARNLIPDDELARLKFGLAVNPEVGDVIPGTGGVRKIRLALGDKGKRSGARVIYYYHDADMPIFLLAAYQKSQKTNLTEGEKGLIKQLVKTLVQENIKRKKK